MPADVRQTIAHLSRTLHGQWFWDAIRDPAADAVAVRVRVDGSAIWRADLMTSQQDNGSRVRTSDLLTVCLAIAGLTDGQTIRVDSLDGSGGPLPASRPGRSRHTVRLSALAPTGATDLAPPHREPMSGAVMVATAGAELQQLRDAAAAGVDIAMAVGGSAERVGLGAARAMEQQTATIGMLARALVDASSGGVAQRSIDALLAATRAEADQRARAERLQAELEDMEDEGPGGIAERVMEMVETIAPEMAPVAMALAARLAPAPTPAPAPAPVAAQVADPAPVTAEAISAALASAAAGDEEAVALVRATMALLSLDQRMALLPILTA